MLEQQTELTCPACTARIERRFTLVCEARGEYFGNEVSFVQCDACGLTLAPGNTHTFGSQTDFDDTSMPCDEHGRVGTKSRPGREYFMGVMAHEILQLAGIEPASLLIYGSGLSLDHQWLAKKFLDLEVCICDLANFQEVANFIALESDRRFDIVIACEVVEHFTELERDFSSLLAKSSPGGILVVSTNISDGGPLPRLAYPFVEGHTAYYSGKAITLLAKRFDPEFQIDFRPPSAALAQLGPRKRYVLLHRDGRIGAAIPEYFAMNLMAPSEPQKRPSAPVRVWRRLVRRLSSQTS